MSTLKALVTCILLISIYSVINADVSEWSWAQRAGGSNIEDGKQIAVDSNGNSYVVGHYKGTAVFGTTNLANTTSFYDVYVAKMDASGNWQWAKRAGGTGTSSNTNGDDMGNAITIDPSGNGIYIAGNFNSSIMYFSGSSISLARGGSNKDAFVAKIDANGIWQWARKAGGTATDSAEAIVANSSNVYVSGSFEGTATFGATNYTSDGYADAFVSKLDTNGTWIWTAKGGGVSADQANGVVLDSGNNVYLVGGFLSATATFGNQSVTSNGSSDVFIAKLNNSGVWQWARRGGGTGFDSGFAIASDSSANIYITGMKESSATFGDTTLPAFGGSDVFIAKLSAQGIWLWAKRAGGTLMEVSWGLCVDSASNVYVTGDFIGSAAFGTFNITSSSTTATDAFFAQLDSQGNWLAASRIGNTGADSGVGVALGSDASLYWFGEYTGTVTFGTTTLTSSSGSQDLYIAKQSYASLALQSPTGGEYWIAGSTHPVNWSASSSINSVLLDYSLNGGTTWLSISADPIAASLGTYNWQVPNISNNTMKVRVRDYADPTRYSMSNSVFTLYIPLTYVSPNGGEGVYFAYNTTQTIQWESEVISHVRLDYSLNAGNTWLPITPDPIPAEAETYSWTIPYVSSDLAKVRIRDYNNSQIFVVSNSVFSLYIPLVMQTLNGGQGVVYPGGCSQEILWTATNVAQVKLDYSLDAGTTWIPITANPINASLGSYPWVLPNIDCSSVKVRISDFANPQTYVMSNSIFEIRRPLTLHSFLGEAGENYCATSTANILWTAFSVQQVALDYSLDCGVNWMPITTSPVNAALGAYPWVLPNVTNYTVRVRVRDYVAPNTYITSEGDFAIIIPPTAPSSLQAGPTVSNPNNFKIRWDAVLTDVNGSPIQPDGYKVYYSTSLSDNMDDFTLLATITDGTEFVHEGACSVLGKVFYKVVAFKN